MACSTLPAPPCKKISGAVAPARLDSKVQEGRGGADRECCLVRGGGAMATEEETIQLELMRQLEELNSLSVALPTKAQVGGQRGSA